MRFLPGNAQHIGARHSQQDSFGFADPDDAAFIEHGGFLAVVCDGMGGMEHGDAASRAAVRAFLDAYGRKSPQESVPEALDRSVREANAQVVALAHSLGKAEGIGTTLVGATLLNAGPGQARLYWVSVGDSGLFHVGGQQMRMINHPHVYSNYLDQAVARGAISRESALTHPERESLTSFIGTEVLEEIDLTTEPMMLSDGDSILLASDGMFKTLAPAEIAACLQGHPQGWPDALVEQTLARRRQSQDNVTVLSVSVEPEEAAQPRSGIYPRSGEFAQNPPAYSPEPVLFAPSAGSASLGATAIGGVPTGQFSAAPTAGSWPPVEPARPPGSPGPAYPSAQGLGYRPPSPPLFQANPGAVAAPPPSQAASRGHGWVWILLGLLLLGAAGAGWWYWSDSLHPASDGPRATRSNEPSSQANAPPHDPNQPLPFPDPQAPAVPEPAGNAGFKGTAR